MKTLRFASLVFFVFLIGHGSAAAQDFSGAAVDIEGGISGAGNVYLGNSGTFDLTGAVSNPDSGAIVIFSSSSGSDAAQTVSGESGSILMPDFSASLSSGTVFNISGNYTLSGLVEDGSAAVGSGTLDTANFLTQDQLAVNPEAIVVLTPEPNVAALLCLGFLIIALAFRPAFARRLRT